MAIKLKVKNPNKPEQKVLSDEEWEEKIGDEKFSLEDFDFSDESDVMDESDIEFNKDDFAFESDSLKENVVKPIPNAKEALITLLRESQFEEPYTIEIKATYPEAKSFIHRMRVELSRFRNKLIKLNKTLDRFSILTQSISMESENRCVITLIKTRYRRRFDNADPEVLSVLNFLESDNT